MSHVTAASGIAEAAQVWIERDGSWEPATLEDAIARRHGRSAPPVWVGVAGATHLGPIAERLGVPPEVLRRAGRNGAHPGRPHLERLPDGGLSLSVPTLSYVERTQDVRTGGLPIVLGWRDPHGRGGRGGMQDGGRAAALPRRPA